MKIVEHGSVTWIDFEAPEAADILFLQENFNIHPLAIEELVTPTYQPRVVRYENCLFLSIHIPLFDTEHRTTFAGELDIILTDTHLITSHARDIFQLRKFLMELGKSAGKRRLHMSETPAHLMYLVLELLIEASFPKLAHISEKLDHIESQVFAGKEKEMVYEISVMKRDVLNFRRALKPQRSLIESLSKETHPFLPEALKLYFQDMVGTNIRLWNIVEGQKETIEALEATNNSLLSNKLNSTMKVLTIFSAILLPMTAYSNIMAMSAGIPFASHPAAFWIHAAIMAFISLVTILVFRLRRWI